MTVPSRREKVRTEKAAASTGLDVLVLGTEPAPQLEEVKPPKSQGEKEERVLQQGRGTLEEETGSHRSP